MYKYSLQKSSKKNHCPKCGKKRFVPYINNETNEILHHTVGRCDREVNCGYHLTPKQFHSPELVSPEFISGSVSHYLKHQSKPKPTYHPNNYIIRSLKKTDNFTTYLHTIFTHEQVKQVLKMYKIGTSTHWKNATIFWQIDYHNNVRSGKVILYDNTGHRSKYATWIHSILLKKKVITTYHLNQCLFGLHLLNTNTKPIAIVESEKTACIMSIAFPKYLWLATGGSNNIADKYFAPLKGRKIILFPDLSANNSIFDKWNQKTLELQKFGFDILTSTLLENIATETNKQNGLDIADFFPLPSLERSLSAVAEGGIRPKEGDGVVKTSPPIISSLRGDACKAEGSSPPFGKACLPSITTILNRSVLPFGKACLPYGRMSEGQMGILSKPQKILKRLISKNPLINQLIEAFDLDIPR